MKIQNTFFEPQAVDNITFVSVLPTEIVLAFPVHSLYGAEPYRQKLDQEDLPNESSDEALEMRIDDWLEREVIDGHFDAMATEAIEAYRDGKIAEF